MSNSSREPADCGIPMKTGLSSSAEELAGGRDRIGLAALRQRTRLGEQFGILTRESCPQRGQMIVSRDEPQESGIGSIGPILGERARQFGLQIILEGGPQEQ